MKRTELKEYMTTRSNAVAACKVGDADEIISVTLSDNTKDILLVSKEGMSIRFKEQEVNAMGRVSGGVKGIQLREGDEIISALWVQEDEGEILTISDIGYAKRSLLVDYLAQSRGGKGVPTFEFKEGKRVKSNGSYIVGAFYCKEPVQIIAVSRSGVSNEITSEQAPISDRKSTGKQLIHLEKNDHIIDLFAK
ncbi:DNA gyrase subunit A [compost metagenome]